MGILYCCRGRNDGSESGKRASPGKELSQSAIKTRGHGSGTPAAADGLEATDDGSLTVHYGYSLATVEGDPLGEKITYPQDLEAAERRLA